MAPALMRFVACDLGNQHCGVVVADVQAGNAEPPSVTIVDMRCVADDAAVFQLVTASAPVAMVLYENTYMFNNWSLLRAQKRLRKACEDADVKTKALLPSQKHSGSVQPGTRSKRRKVDAVTSARLWLTQHAPGWLPAFDGMDRNHDVADALLMLLYHAHRL